MIIAPLQCKTREMAEYDCVHLILKLDDRGITIMIVAMNETQMLILWTPACAGVTACIPRHSRAGGNPGLCEKTRIS